MRVDMLNNGFAIIDDQDEHVVRNHRWGRYWFGDGLYYASCKVGKDTVYMHRLILSAQKGQYVDHIDRDGMNNRRENLRLTSQSINIANSSLFSNNTTGFRGVIVYRNGYRAQVKRRIGGKQVNVQSNTVGNITTAALIRDELARRMFGSDIYLNFPGIEPNGVVLEEADSAIARYHITT